MGKWESLVITAEEEIVYGVCDEIMAKGKEGDKWGLLGKLLSQKPFNRKAFRCTILEILRVKNGLTINEVDRDIFLFSFGDPKEIDKVLNEPWIFDKSMLVLKIYDADKTVDYNDFVFTKFWVQVFNLPPSGMRPEMGEMMGDIISEFVDVIKNSDSKCVGQFLRVRVAIDVSKPLRSGVRLRLGGGGPVVWGDLF